MAGHCADSLCLLRCAVLCCTEATNSRVAWFNILAAGLVCTFCGWQLWYLNKASSCWLLAAGWLDPCMAGAVAGCFRASL